MQGDQHSRPGGKRSTPKPLVFVDSQTGEPCPTKGKSLCTIKDSSHRHMADWLFPPKPVDEDRTPTEIQADLLEAARAQALENIDEDQLAAVAMNSLPKQARGLFFKYYVQRIDGTDAEGGKHYDCEYFVLDLTHDPLARLAYASYAMRARIRGYKQLGDDMRATLHRLTLSHPLDGRQPRPKTPAQKQQEESDD